MVDGWVSECYGMRLERRVGCGLEEDGFGMVDLDYA